MSGSQMHSSNHVLLATQPDVHCLVCTRPFTLDTEMTDSFEALAICRECKITVLANTNRDELIRTHPERRRRRTRSRMTRFEAFDAAFSQRLSHLANLVTQGDAGIDSPSVSRQQASYDSTPNRSQGWHASDDDSDGLNYADSMSAEIESNISFGDYGGESDTSLDQHAVMGRQVAIQLGNESYLNTDTDIDPMNAGRDQWDSDDQEDDEDEQSEESDFEAVDTMQQRPQRWHEIAPSGLSEQESEDVIWTWRTAGSQGVTTTNLREDTEGPEIRRLFIGNLGDYVDARQFEMLLEQFAEENNNTRRGAPPAATSFIENLPSLAISKSHETNGGVTCAVCKDHMPTRTMAKQLPCTHLYHASCILPWLSSRNTCPVCRYELPTDDLEYERSKQATTNERGILEVEHAHVQGTVEEISDEPEVEGDTMEETDMSEPAVIAAQQPNRARGRHRWLFATAAPVVSLVGLALVLCFTNPGRNVRRQLCRRPHSTTTTHVDTRSWWSMF